MSSLPSPVAAATTSSRDRLVALFLVSVLGLFLEMMLIRWIGTEVRVFAYLQNTILVVCFLGLGMGCFTCRQPTTPRQLLLPLLTLVVLLAVPFTRQAVGNIGNWLSVISDMVLWMQESAGNPGEAVFKVVVGVLLAFFLMVLLWEIFLPLGRILGRLMDDHPSTIVAYSVNVAGSLVGILLFALVSALYCPPAVWAALTAVLLLPFVFQGQQRWGDVGLLAAVVAGCLVAGYEPGAEGVTWSAYQKLALFEVNDQHKQFPGKYLITVNNAGYQGIIDLRPQSVRDNPRMRQAEVGMSQYDVPTLFQPRPARALCVGSGSGNDVAGVLRGGAQAVTAVEIDPAIVTLGRQRHPEKPYDDPRVRAVIDDARSHFATTDERYDLIVFGLLDSHTTTAMTNARLDHYVYTRESLQRVRALLAAKGVVVLSFEVAKPFIADRMSRMLTEVFGWKPLAFRINASAAGWGGVLFITGDEAVVRAALTNNERLAAQVAAWQTETPISLDHATPVTTDDWPYLYLESARIPSLYLLLGVLLLGLVGYAVYRLRAPALSPAQWDRSLWHFFLLGAAFMLLEVQNISKAAVVLGNTWQVNGVIVAGVLAMILLANLVAAVWPRLPVRLVGTCLILSCLGLYGFDLSSLAFLAYPVKAVLVGLLTALPMFFSGLLFIRSFADTARKDVALGANLLGSLAGALVQSVTFATGIKGLLLIVAALYLLALLTRPRDAAVPGEARDTSLPLPEAGQPVPVTP